MTGDQADIAARLRSVLPARWFGASTPVLDTVLNAIAAGWTHAYDFLRYTERQARIGSATDVWLDLVSQDFFGAGSQRGAQQSDAAFRRTIQRNILRPLGTRAAVVSLLTDLTGRAPRVFEPRNTADTGGYGGLATTNGGGTGYCTAGGWGSLALPFQCFVTAFRPNINGAANLAGWGICTGGYGIGALEYVSADAADGHVADDEILAELARVAPIGTVIWANISS